ncbi:MAG TPA: alpha/beta hydrolase-fold protein [Erysipelothrix sp.]
MIKHRIQSTSFYSKTLGFDLNYSVYPGDKHHPIIYMLHGAYGNHRDFYTQTDLQADLKFLQYPGTIIFVDALNSYYLNSRHLKMETAIIEDLLPYMEKQYAFNGQRVIWGISMGGYGALKLGMKYPELFTTVVSMSPGIWLDPPESSALKQWDIFKDETRFDLTFWQNEHPLHYLRPLTNHYYLITGQDDHLTDFASVDYFYQKAKDTLQIDYTVDPHGPHAWYYWSAIMLRTFLQLQADQRL